MLNISSSYTSRHHNNTHDHVLMLRLDRNGLGNLSRSLYIISSLTTTLSTHHCGYFGLLKSTIVGQGLINSVARA